MPSFNHNLHNRMCSKYVFTIDKTVKAVNYEYNNKQMSTTLLIASTISPDTKTQCIS